MSISVNVHRKSTIKIRSNTKSNTSSKVKVVSTYLNKNGLQNRSITINAINQHSKKGCG